MSQDEQVWRYQIGWPERYPKAEPLSLKAIERLRGLGNVAQEAPQRYADALARWQMTGYSQPLRDFGSSGSVLSDIGGLLGGIGGILR